LSGSLLNKASRKSLVDVIQDDEAPDFANHIIDHVKEDIEKAIHELHDHPPILYKRRWWVFVLFSLLGMMQNVIWITYSPVVKPTIELFEISEDMINYIVAQAALVFLFVLPISTWMLDNWGLRKCVIIFGVIQTVGSGIRIVGTGPSTFWWVFAGQVLNAIPGPIWSAAPTRVSNLWFSVKERTIVTFGIIMALNFGVTTGFLESFGVNHKMELWWLVVIHTAICLVLIILVIFTFPDSPPTPPTVSASIHSHHVTERGMWMDTKDVMTNYSYVIITAAVGGTLGCSYGWNAALGTNLGPLGFSQDQIAWLGAGATFAGIVTGVLVIFIKRLKLAIVLLFLTATIFFLWFQLLVMRILPGNFIVIFVACVVGNMCLNIALPVAYEMAVEITFPVSEVISTGIITQITNLTTLIFIIISGYIGGIAMNWIMVGSLGASFLALCFLRENYYRRNVDNKVEE